VTLPPNVPEDQRQHYEELAANVAGNNEGTLPNGSAVAFPDAGSRGGTPFRKHLDYQDQQIVMAITGGLLTMLAESGSGNLAGGAHSDTFKRVTRALAGRVSESFQRQFDAEILAAAHPGQPVLAYFEISANEEQNVGEFIKDVGGLAGAGYEMTAAFIEEKTGYPVAARPAPAAAAMARLTNRAADGEDLSARLAQLLAADDTRFAAVLQDLQKDWPELLKTADGETVKEWEGLLGGELLKALQNTRDANGAEHGEDDGKFTVGGAGGATPAQLEQFYDAAINGDRAVNAKIKTYSVSDAQAERIKRDAGVDVAGYHHVMQGGNVRHAIDRHGDAPAEALRGQLAVTKADIARVPEITRTADKVIKGEPVNGLERIRYVKREGDTSVVVEEARTGKKELAFVTMFKFKGKVEFGNRAALDASTPSCTSVTLRPEDTIEETARKVNQILQALREETK
jgi:hypothetical protein